ncbi:hypothetical protein LTR84_012825 [Exophiala bonariae]|uniref:C2H2-type domain-containing protein n=1 Tax=Exophiala bonariae TaxID=1690606 RepID=A0AAV9MRL0_9EURO|nr:hypothetical protein LTR84_012825 [Exophiala bonariae]
MERIQHCVTAAANQSDLDARRQALRAKHTSLDHQVDQLRSDRDDEDLEEILSDQREAEKIDTKRKAEDEDRIASKKCRYEQKVKKRKVEDEGCERSRASLGAETVSFFQALDLETYKYMLDVLGEYPLKQRQDLKQHSRSQVPGASLTVPCSTAEPKEFPDLPKAQSHRSDAEYTGPGTGARVSNKGKSACGTCGRRFYRRITRDNREKQHEDGHPNRCPELGDHKPFGTKNSAMMRAKLIYEETHPYYDSSDKASSQSEQSTPPTKSEQVCPEKKRPMIILKIGTKSENQG